MTNSYESPTPLYQIDLSEYFCSDGKTITYHNTGREVTRQAYPAEQLYWGQSVNQYGAYNASYTSYTSDTYGYCPHGTISGGVSVFTGSITINCAWDTSTADQLTVYAQLFSGSVQDPSVPQAEFRAVDGNYYWATYEGFH